jgi:outer membrane protein TolC
MKKKLWIAGIVCLLITLVVAMPVTADEKYQFNYEIPQVVTETQEEITLTLEGAKTMVLEGNPDLELSDVGLDKAKFLDRKQKKDSDNISTSSYNMFASNYERALGKYVGKKATEVGLEIAEATYELTENGIAFGAQNNYYELLKAQASLKNAENALTRAQEQLRITQAFLKAGMVSQGEVMGAEALVAGKEAALAGKRASHENAMMNMAAQLSLPLNTPIVATDGFTYEPVQVDLDIAIAEGMIKDVALLGSKGAYEIAMTGYALADAYYTTNTNIYKEQKYTMLEAKLQYESQLQQSEQKIRSAYTNLAATEEAYLSFEKNVKYSKESYRVVKLRYQEGMATRLEMEEAEGALSEAEDAATSMLLTYELVKASFTYSLFM